MHTQILKVRQTGRRTVRIAREFTMEVPHHVAKDPQLLQDWIARRNPTTFWEPDGDHYIVIEETKALGHSTQAIYPMTESEREKVSR